MTGSQNFPRIARDEKGIKTFFLNDRPYLMRAGEIHNSSASSAEYMETEVWPYLRDLNMNTVLATVAWEDVEPVEGQYDFALVESLLQQARREKMRLVILWFGLWKNGESYYVPRWVKHDTDTYFRIRPKKGAVCDTISPFCKAAVEKDKAAFSRLMGYLSEHDKENTVIMIQVENEIGLLNAYRDHGEAAEAALSGPVPADLAAQYGVSGTWDEAFGKDAGEYLMAYHYAKAVETIASAGKAVWPLPMYVNAWQDQHPARPGYYPTGGPISKMIPLWLHMAPSIDLCAPDIYAADFLDVCQRYTTEENPLFIPETVRAPMNASNLFYVFTELNCIGYAPFGIEDIMRDKAPETPAYLAESYKILRETEPLWLAARGTDRLHGFLKRSPNESGTILSLATCDLVLDYLPGGGDKPGTGGFVLETEDGDGFWIVGCNVKFRLFPKVESDDIMGLPRMEEGEFKDGEWHRRRILNGDEVWRTSLGDVPTCRYIGLNTYTY